MNTEEIRKNIKRLLSEKNIPLREASIYIGQNEAYMHQFFSKRSPVRLPEEQRKRLSMLLGVGEQELTDIKIHKSETDTSSDMVRIEIIDAAASCGCGIENFNPVPIGYQLISIKSLKEITNSKAENINIIKARGDSMEPTINDSDVIWVDISYNFIAGDGIYLFCIGSELYAKRVRINFLDNSARITSDNPKYEPIDANKYGNIQVIGKVISINKMLG